MQEGCRLRLFESFGTFESFKCVPCNRAQVHTENDPNEPNDFS